jgi:hypothetical protein
VAALSPLLFNATFSEPVLGASRQFVQALVVPIVALFAACALRDSVISTALSGRTSASFVQFCVQA